MQDYRAPSNPSSASDLMSSAGCGCVYSTATMNHPKFRSMLLFPLLLVCAVALAQGRVAAALDSLPSVKKIDQVAISPDGTQVAYIVEGELSAASGGGRAPPQNAAGHEITNPP